MVPVWNKLMDEFAGDANKLIADVDCTSEGKPLCDSVGVKGFPTIKYGDPGDLKDYQGGRDYEELKKFASENLGPTCGPDYMDLCDAKSKDKINKYMAMSTADLEAKIKKAIEVVEVDIPIMNKAISYAKSKK